MQKQFKCESPALKQAQELACEYGLENHGILQTGNVYWNLPTPALYEEAIFRSEGYMTNGGPLIVNTGKWTARAATDKYLVKEPENEGKIWWGKNNQPLPPEKFDLLLSRVQAYLQGRDVFVQDCYVGADPKYRMPIRVITQDAWQSLFARNMFIPLSKQEEYKKHVPGFTLIAVPDFRANPKTEGTRSETVIVINFAKQIALVIGSGYGGEIKKTYFTILNYLLPLKNIMSMHCSANVGAEGDVALFFGLSGTGKTSLSADPNRKLIGDDEHGWSDDGVFNFEGGCYAKVIRLSAQYEPQIYCCTSRFGTILENVVFDPTTRKIDLNDDKFTENTRASYPLEFIDNALSEKMTRTQPKNVVFLTCDASGVLPPIALLDKNQAMYHFISGYTSKIAGTEMGLGVEPQITFSACFGAPFMVHHPFYYAELLSKMLEKHNAHCWLVNTGWVGGKFGVGKRISIHYTRAMLNAALEGKLEKVEFKKDKLFGFQVPMSCPGIPDDVFKPESAWADKNEYWAKYDSLAARFIENFKLYAENCPREVAAAGPKRLSD
ncbi:MAG: phosphoenolpyruvate carboxykinase (ATP) [Acidobacteria bacterium]|jgi:phosphoenolpyruvate carboxykinase (ATP)|nr:phosphoenolpyruvate carboxykinase (ATP) [Acidobacteriota bacterium]